MKTTVIIVTHESAGVLDDALTALHRIPNLPIMVVDNASADASAAIAERRNARLIRLPKNLGFAAAANRGARCCDADLLCFLNPDCLLDEATVAAAAAALGTDPMACAVPDFRHDAELVAGCQPGYSQWKVLADILETNGWRPDWIARLKARPDYHDHTWHWPLGTCLFVRRAFFEQLGGFDESYFLYMEDVDFGRRLCAAGGIVVPLGIPVRHLSMRGAEVSRARRMKLLNGNRIRFARKHYGLLFSLFLRMVWAGANMRNR